MTTTYSRIQPACPSSCAADCCADHLCHLGHRVCIQARHDAGDFTGFPDLQQATAIGRIFSVAAVIVVVVWVLDLILGGAA